MTSICSLMSEYEGGNQIRKEKQRFSARALREEKNRESSDRKRIS